VERYAGRLAARGDLGHRLITPISLLTHAAETTAGRPAIARSSADYDAVARHRQDDLLSAEVTDGVRRPRIALCSIAVTRRIRRPASRGQGRPAIARLSASVPPLNHLPARHRRPLPPSIRSSSPPGGGRSDGRSTDSRRTARRRSGVAW
jgi:hypothetical protein